MSNVSYARNMRRRFWAALLLFGVTFGLQVATSPSPGIVGLELAFTESRASSLVLEQWDKPERNRAKRNIRLDFLFIVAYVWLLTVVIRWTMRDDDRSWLWDHGKKLVWLAVAAGGLDVIENLLMLRFVRSAPAVGAPPVAATGVAASLKFALLLSIVVTWFRWLRRDRPEVLTGTKNWLIDFWSILKLCRANVIVLLVGAAFLLLVPQGRDVVIALAEPPLRARLGFLIWFFIAASFWALNIWYWARTMLRFNWDVRSTDKGRSGRAERIREHFPRLLGTLAFLTVAAGFLRAAIDTEGDTATGHWVLAGWSVILAVLFYGMTVARRNLTKKLQQQAQRINPWKKGRTARALASVAVEPRAQAYSTTLQRAHDLDTVVRFFLTLLFLLTLAMFVMFSINPATGTFFRSAPILLLAGAAWVPVGALLVYISYRFRFPLLATVVAALVLFSYINDNHAVRTLPGARTQLADSVSGHFDSWLGARGIVGGTIGDVGEESDASSAAPYPVIVVAAEGGGIRAAYWTANVLGRLQDKYSGPNGETFAHHVYAISGVSGGSLGAAVFSSLVKEQLSGTQLDCSGPRGGNTGAKGAVEGCADRMLRRDFLSPTLAAMLYPDLVQRFLFFPIPRFDRGRALEQAWERAWDSLPGVESGRFGGREKDASFDDLWKGGGADTEHRYHVPLLFLNTTWVEAGRRVLISPIKIGAEFADTEDYFDAARNQIRLSSAVHNSARFTFVSPAGTVKTADSDVWGHVVDGGYFENSGATTALEILQAMKRGAGNRWATRVQPIVLLISNDPKLGSEPEPRRFLKEALSPIVAMLQARGARGSYSRDALRDEFGERCRECFVEIDLQGVEGVPLGWVLSGGAQRQMNREIGSKIKPVLKLL